MPLQGVYLGNTMKQPLLAIARRAYLLPILEAVRFAVLWLKTNKRNAQFKKEKPDFVCPSTWWMHDMYAHTDLDVYYESGVTHATVLIDLLRRHLGDGEFDVADWGCGMARVTRHLGDKHRVVAFDANKAATDWITAKLPNISAYAHGPLPPLPVDDSCLDAIYGISVLTHLPKADAQAWLTEVLRVLRPRGIFVCTVHGVGQVQSLTHSERAKFDLGTPIYRGNVKRGSRNYATYLPEEFLREELFADFSIEDGPKQEFGQELWVLRKN